MRPTTYTPEIGDEICALLADGVSLTKICAEDKYPSTVTVYAWLRKHPEFLNNYTRAREDQADTLADEIIEISDDGSNDTYTDEDGHTTTNFDVIARSKLRVEARKWVAAKLKPKKYGDRATHEITGADGGPIESKVTVEFVNPTP